MLYKSIKGCSYHSEIIREGATLPTNSQLLIFVIFIGAALLFAFVASTTPYPLANVAFGILSLLLAVVAFSTKYYSYLVLPALRMKGRAMVLSADDPFYMAPSGNALIVKEGSNSYASVFIKIPVYRSSTEMSAAEKADFARLFSRILALTKSPVKISSQLYVINKDDYINSIRNKLNEAGERYAESEAKKGVPKSVSERIRGEVTMWRNLLNNVSEVHSQSLFTYAMLTAMGGSDEEAVNIAVQQAEELAAGISATLGVNASIATGSEMLNFTEPDYMIPVETVSERLRQKTIEEGI